MSGDVADFMFANMSGTSRGRSATGAFPGSAGAVIKGDVLYLATVKRDDLGRLRLQQEFTRQFRMPGRLQPAVRAFSMEVAKFFKSATFAACCCAVRRTAASIRCRPKAMRSSAR